MCLLTFLTGAPTPTLHWLLDGKLIDEFSEEVKENFIHNELQLFQLQREKMNSRISCEAQYHPKFPPEEASAIIDMYHE